MKKMISLPRSEAEKTARSQLKFTRLITAYMPISFAQWIIPRTVANMRLPDGIEKQSVIANGVPCDWLIPQGSASDKVLLYLHGGGFIYGASTLHYEMVAYLAKQMGIRVLMVNYRLAPKHPFPAGLDDCVTAYRWLIEHGFSSENIVIAGDSAGGNLTITTLMRLRDAGEALPKAAACLSPVGDMTEDSKREVEIDDEVLHPRAARFMRRSYIADNDARHPLISPLYGEWDGLPPLLIHAGETESLYDDAVKIHQAACDTNLDVTLEIYENMWHVWQIFPDLPQTRHSLDRIAQYLSEHLRS